MSRAALGACCLTLQSVAEFFAVATRKRMMLPGEAAPVAEAMLALFPAASATAVRAALRQAASGRASYWNALLLHTAAEAGCTAILSERPSDGAVVARVRVINPFAADGLSAAAEAVLSVDD